jgi:two-component system chemotaxis sensor kinase CheA
VSESEPIDAEFRAEAHAIVESLSRDLLLLGHEHEAGRSATELLDAVHRGVLTLESLAGLCGASALVLVTAPLSALLERLRTGQLPLDDARLDALSESVGVIERLLTAPRAQPLDAASADSHGKLRAMRDEGGQSPKVPLRRTVPVDVERLDRLLELASDLETSQSAVRELAERLGRGTEPAATRTALRRAERRLTRQLADLRGGLLEVRRVPLEETFAALAEAALETARDLGGEVLVRVEGGEIPVDERVVAELRGPLLELVRHAARRGPPHEGRSRRPQRMTLRASERGGQVSVELHGLGPEVAPPEAATTGSPRLEAPADEDGRLALPQPSSIVPRVHVPSGEPPLSLARVRDGLARVGGALDIEPDDGVTRFTLTVPVDLVCVRSLLVRAGGERFAVPIAAIDEARFFDPEALRLVEGREWIVVRGEALPIARLAARLGLGAEDAPLRSGPSRHGFVVVLRVGRRRLGLVVDRLEGERDLLPKPLGPSLASVRCFRGAAVLGDHALVLVLDPAVLLDEALAG